MKKSVFNLNTAFVVAITMIGIMSLEADAKSKCIRSDCMRDRADGSSYCYLHTPSSSSSSYSGSTKKYSSGSSSYSSSKKSTSSSSKSSSSKKSSDPYSVDNYRHGGMEKLDGGGERWVYNKDGKYSIFEENSRRAYDEELRRSMYGD